MDISIKLIKKLDGAKYVKYLEGQYLVLAWYGGQGFEVYNFKGDAVNHHTVGGAGKPSLSEVKSLMNDVYGQDKSNNDDFDLW